MTHDHDHVQPAGSARHNGHRPHPGEPHSFETTSHEERGVSPSPANWNDEAARTADDALMRCYNG